jgi:sulfite reductase alpha subunit-like flavoprotein
MIARQGKEIATMILLYGCRTPSEDFLYEDEWKVSHSRGSMPLRVRSFGQSDIFQGYAEELGDSFKMYTAFSCQTKQKAYVQDILRQRASEFIGLIRQRGQIYVCGDAKMGQDVYKMLCKILAGERQCNEHEAEQAMADMRRRQEYHVSGLLKMMPGNSWGDANSV